MTFQQLEYIVALSKTRHFVNAAEMCGVTQPTLSMMVQKLEDELDIRIFDRSKHPIEVTKIGEKIIDQAQITLAQLNRINELVSAEKGDVSGNINIAIIPTVAPYVLPKFFAKFKSMYPELSFKISEMRTDTIEKMLHLGEIDMGILSTPLMNPNILEIPLYYEKFIAYISPNDRLYQKKELVSTELPVEHLWVLEEGHCLRNQVFNFCMKDMDVSYAYEAGSIETLIKIVDENGGYTVIPELHLEFLTDEQKKNVRKLVDPEPVREISLVIQQNFIREGQLNAVADIIKKIIPKEMLDGRLKKFAIKI
ncbi:MAG: LysR family transcriptional regulator [Bacteroidales bacterium]|nr:LysR family transcriptional regulator [Bacteroidales bacterium]